MTGNVPPDRVRDAFRPEFLNRLDRVLRFEPLDGPALEAIAASALGHLAAMVEAEHQVELTLGPAAARAVADAVADEVASYGARPLRRYVEQVVATDLARIVLSNELPADRRLVLDVGGDGALAFYPGRGRGGEEL